MKLLVINADDFGQSRGTNQAILEAHLQGVLSSTSCMANMPAIEEAAKLWKQNPTLGVGAHVSLNVGRPVLPPSTVPLLVNSQGLFHGSYLQHLRLSSDPTYLEQAAREIEAQILKLKALGFFLDHLNGQSHIQMIPGLYQLFYKAALRHGLWLRNSQERLWGHPRPAPKNFLKNLLINHLGSYCQKTQESEFLGIRQSGVMDKKALLFYLANLKGDKVELLSHPAQGEPDAGYPLQPFVSAWITHPGRLIEKEALLASEVKSGLKASGRKLCTFAEMAIL